MNTYTKEFHNLGYELEINGDIACLKRVSKRARRGYKIVWNYRFKTLERMEKYIKESYDNIIYSLQQKEQRRQEKKERDAKALAAVQVGDIFVDSWGYEQTQVDFYEVIEKPSKCYIILRPIASESIEATGPMSDRVKPAPGEFTGNPIRKKLNGQSFKVNSYSWAYKVSDPKNETFHRSWYY